MGPEQHVYGVMSLPTVIHSESRSSNILDRQRWPRVHLNVSEGAARTLCWSINMTEASWQPRSLGTAQPLSPRSLKRLSVTAIQSHGAERMGGHGEARWAPCFRCRVGTDLLSRWEGDFLSEAVPSFTINFICVIFLLFLNNPFHFSKVLATGINIIKYRPELSTQERKTPLQLISFMTFCLCASSLQLSYPIYV